MVECAKIVVVTTNVIFMIFGLAILIVGIVFKVDTWDKVRDAFVDNSDKVDINLQDAGDTLGLSCIIFGSFMVLLSLMGCVGGCCRVKFLLVVYAIIVLIILIAQIAVVGLVAANGSDAEDKLTEGLRDSLQPYRENLTDSRSKGWAAVFSTFECCGIANKTDGFSDMERDPRRSQVQMGQNPLFPIACCKNYDYESSENQFSNDDIIKCLNDGDTTKAYQDGCEAKVSDFITDNKVPLIAVGVTIFIIEIVCVMLAFFLCCRNDD